MKLPPQSIHEIAINIRLAFLEKHNLDFQKTRDFIHSLLITDIEDGDRIIIKTARPGLLIGRKGENITFLEAKLGKRIEIVESFSWADWVTPISPAEEEMYRQETEAYDSFSDFLQNSYPSTMPT